MDINQFHLKHKHEVLHLKKAIYNAKLRLIIQDN